MRPFLEGHGLEEHAVNPLGGMFARSLPDCSHEMCTGWRGPQRRSRAEDRSYLQLKQFSASILTRP